VACNKVKPTYLVGVFVGFLGIFLLGILIFKVLTARRLYKSFGVEGSNPYAKQVAMCHFSPDFNS
jgi:hypothetical protein